MGCPDAIVAHLSGLKDVKKISFYPQNRTFDMELGVSFGKTELEDELSVVSKKERRHFRLVRYEENT